MVVIVYTSKSVAFRERVLYSIIEHAIFVSS
jgi:hypothetical protein